MTSLIRPPPTTIHAKTFSPTTNYPCIQDSAKIYYVYTSTLAGAVAGFSRFLRREYTSGVFGYAIGGPVVGVGGRKFRGRGLGGEWLGLFLRGFWGGGLFRLFVLDVLLD
jgi:hypothetical protein